MSTSPVNSNNNNNVNTGLSTTQEPVADTTAAAEITKSLKKSKIKDSYLPTEMNSINLMGFGNSKQLRKMRVPLPVPGDGEVLVKIQACGINFADIQVRQGLFENLPKLPFIPGFECAGEIVKLGPNTTGYQIGERVICLSKTSAWAEYISMNGNYIYKIPDQMTFKDAAALSYNYLTAYILLYELGGIKPGQTVLFHSAGGGVGIALTQLTKLVNNITIIGTCSKNKFDALKHHVPHLLDENATIDYVQEVKKLYPEGVDLVLDCLSGDHTNKGVTLVKPMGKYIIYGTAKNLEGESKNFFTIAKNWWQVDKISPLKLYEDNVTISGFNLYNFLYNNNVTNSRRYILDVFGKLFALYREGKIKPVIDSIHSFDNIANALAQLQERKNIGKVILDPYYDENTSKVKIEKDRHSSDTSGPDEADEPAANEDLL